MRGGRWRGQGARGLGVAGVNSSEGYGSKIHALEFAGG